MFPSGRNCTEQSITIIIGSVSSLSVEKRCCEWWLIFSSIFNRRLTSMQLLAPFPSPCLLQRSGPFSSLPRIDSHHRAEEPIRQHRAWCDDHLSRWRTLIIWRVCYLTQTWTPWVLNSEKYGFVVSDFENVDFFQQLTFFLPQYGPRIYQLTVNSSRFLSKTSESDGNLHTLRIRGNS